MQNDEINHILYEKHSSAEGNMQLSLILMGDG